MTEKLTDSPVDWVLDHTRRYLESGGEDGHDWGPGVSTLLLTTVGRTTGIRRRTALIYGRDGDQFVIVASKGGAPEHPSWYLNLQANPRVELQVRDENFPALATTAQGAQREVLWALMCEIWPAYAEYATKTDREIPVVVLTHTA